MEMISAFICYPQGINKIKTVEKDGLTAKFYAPNSHTAWRYKTLFIKEPETITWMAALKDTDILWDVGANVGIYTIYAAMVTGAKVYAIEPGAANYWTLCKNVELNKLDDKVTTLCMALGEEHKCADLFLSSSDSGGAQNALDKPLNDQGKEFVPQFRQGMLSIPADVMVKQLGVPCPTAIKIDVDGFELPVLRGAYTVLRNPVLKKISLELDSSRADLCDKAIGLVQEAGFKKVGEFRSPYVAAKSPIHNFHFERD